MIGRELIIDVLSARFASEERARALWEAGSAAFDRVDAHSDIDLVLALRGEDREPAFAAAEEALSGLANIEDQWRLPEPTFHGHSQAFYRLAGCPPTLLVDLLVLRDDAEDKLLAPERHGSPRLLFDKDGLVSPPPFDAKAFAARAARELEHARARARMLGPFVAKAIARGHSVEALAWYRAFLIRPLVLALGLRHRPMRYDFGERYLRQDLPEAEFRRLEDLVYIGDPSQLAAKATRVQAWLSEVLAGIDLAPERFAEASARVRGGDRLEPPRENQDPG